MRSDIRRVVWLLVRWSPDVAHGSLSGVEAFVRDNWSAVDVRAALDAVEQKLMKRAVGDFDTVVMPGPVLELMRMARLGAFSGADAIPPTGADLLRRHAGRRRRPSSKALASADPLHPTGRCTCAGEGHCEWCRSIAEMEHELKTWPAAYEAVATGVKRAEYRRDDRPYRVGDILLLREFEPEPTSYRSAPGYTGRSLRKRITHATRGPFIPDGFVMLSLGDEDEEVIS